MTPPVPRHIGHLDGGPGVGLSMRRAVMTLPLPAHLGQIMGPPVPATKPSNRRELLGRTARNTATRR